MIQPVNGLDLASHIIVLRRVEEVPDSWVLLVAAEDVLSLLLSTVLSVQPQFRPFVPSRTCLAGRHRLL